MPRTSFNMTYGKLSANITKCMSAVSLHVSDALDRSAAKHPQYQSIASHYQYDWFDERTLIHVVDVEKRRLDRLRRRASRLGVKVRVSRRRIGSSVNHGGVLLVDAQDVVIAGEDFDLTISEAEARLTAMGKSEPQAIN